MKHSFTFFACFFLLVFLFAPLHAQFADPKVIKSTYGITEQEIEGYLNSLKQAEPTLYQYLLQLKDRDTKQFERTVVMAIVSRRVKKTDLPETGSINQRLQELQTELTKVYNISNEELNAFWDKMSRDNPSLYKALMELKKTDKQRVDTLATQEIIWRRGGATAAASGVMGPLDSFALQEKIKQQVSNFKGASDEIEGKRALANLEELVRKSFQNYIKTLDNQASALKSSLQSIEKTKSDFINNKEKKIKERVNFYLTLP